MKCVSAASAEIPPRSAARAQTALTVNSRRDSVRADAAFSTILNEVAFKIGDVPRSGNGHVGWYRRC